MTTRRAQGLCFNYDEQFIPGHRCKKLYIMEIDPFLDDDGAAADTGKVEVMAISLAAIAGVQPRSGNTLRLIVTIGGKD
jgi:hypothetical protein